jgi:hypothetical protein
MPVTTLVNALFASLVGEDALINNTFRNGLLTSRSLCYHAGSAKGMIDVQAAAILSYRSIPQGTAYPDCFRGQTLGWGICIVL